MLPQSVQIRVQPTDNLDFGLMRPSIEEPLGLLTSKREAIKECYFKPLSLW